tara:strand:- start:233 stop:1027 length:795 start_codon:yes stop_codon:yes gene_type:complete
MTDERSISEYSKSLRNIEIQNDLRQFLGYQNAFDTNGSIKGKDEIERASNLKDYLKRRNALARDSKVDYRLLQDIVEKTKFNQTFETEKKLRYLAQKLGLSIPYIENSMALMAAFSFDDPVRMSMEIEIHLAPDVKNFCIPQEAKHSIEIVEIIETLKLIRDDFKSEFPVSPYEYHKSFVPKFTEDSNVVNLWELLGKYNIVLYGRRMNQWLHDLDQDHVIVFQLYKYPYEERDNDGNFIREYIASLEVDRQTTYQYVEDFRYI